MKTETTKLLERALSIGINDSETLGKLALFSELYEEDKPKELNVSAIKAVDAMLELGKMEVGPIGEALVAGLEQSEDKEGALNSMGYSNAFIPANRTMANNRDIKMPWEEE